MSGDFLPKLLGYKEPETFFEASLFVSFDGDLSGEEGCRRKEGKREPELSRFCFKYQWEEKKKLLGWWGVVAVVGPMWL